MTTTTVSNVNFRKGNLRYFEGTIKNETLSEVTLAEGSLLGFDKTDGKFFAYAGGIEKPKAIVAQAVTIAASSESTEAPCVAGDVNGSALILPGSYALDDVPSSNAGTAIAITADAGNTGDGTAGAITQGASAIAGTYTLTCTEATTDLAITADSGNTGDGAAGAITAGASLQDGTYLLTCITAQADAGIFRVQAPDGTILANLTVGVAYDNGHFAVTIADGAADFIVGDLFTVVSAAGKFQVISPNNDILPDLTVGVAYDNGHFAVTIADGATNFIVGDLFTVVTNISAEGSIRMMLKDTGIIAQDVVQLVS